MTRAQKAEKALQIAEKFIKEHEIYHPESIYQSDGIMLALPELLNELGEAIGWLPYPEDVG